MKHVIISMMVLLAILSSCGKEDSSSSATEQTISAILLPLKVTEYIANNYPAESISTAVQVTNGTATYIVSLNTTEELAFDHNGEFLGNGAYYHPGCDSLGNNYDSLEIHGDSLGEHGGHGHGEHGGHGGHEGPGHGGHGGISVDSLPAAISKYITNNFSGYTAQHAEIEANCQFDSVYVVMIVIDTLHPVKAYFGLTGNYLMKSSRASYTDAPQLIKDYIIANYAGYTVMKKMEIFTMADNSLEYIVFMDLNHSSKKYVLLNADGTLICGK